MAISSDTGRVRGRPFRSPKGPPAVAPLAPTVVLTVTFAIAAFAIVLASAELLVNPEPLPPPFNLGENQNLESALYLMAFALLLPAALILVPRLAERISTTPNARALPFLAALLAAALAASIILARVLSGDGVAGLLGAVGLWSAAAVALLTRARQSHPWDPLLRASRREGSTWALAGALVFGSLLAFTSARSISLVPVALGAVAVPAVLVLYARLPAVRRRMPGRWGVVADAAIVALILLAVPDLVIFQPAGPPDAFLTAFNKSVILFHHNFVLGPAQVVLHGGAMLVGTASQYGVGSIYFLTGWFQLAPIGYGTLGFLDGALFALFFAAAYCLLRLVHTPRPLAAAAMAVAVIALIYNLLYSVGSLPAQHGPLRFGLPLVLILAAVAEARWQRHGRAARAGQLAVVGLASIWALEAFAYTVVTFAAMAGFQAWTRPAPGRLAWLARRAALALAGCLAAQLALVGATLAFAGELPDYGWYLAFLQSFLFGIVGNITYDFSRWSPAVAVGVAYSASAAAFVLLTRRRRGLVERERGALTALCGLTAYGIILFSYFVDRSADHIVPYVSLPALLAGTVWLSLLLRGALGGSRSVRLGGLAFAMALAVLLVSVGWSSIGDRLSRSALGHVVPGGDSPATALRTLWNAPPLDPRAAQGEALLARFMPGEPRVPTLVSPDLEVEILIRSDRTNAFPLSYPTADSFVPSQYLPDLRRSVAELEEGDRLLTQVDGLKVFAALRSQPFRDLLARPVAGTSMAPLQAWVLQRISQRFDLEAIHRDELGFVVATLVPRR